MQLPTIKLRQIRLPKKWRICRKLLMIYAGRRPARDKILCVKRKVKYLRGDMYKILRSILFFFPAEGVHHFSMKGLKLLCGGGLLGRLVAWSCRREEGAPGGGSGGSGLERQVFGLSF